MRTDSLAAELGFEPRQTESESAVLPLHNSATNSDYYTHPLHNCQYFFKTFQKNLPINIHSPLCSVKNCCTDKEDTRCQKNLRRKVSYNIEDLQRSVLFLSRKQNYAEAAVG